ncbi:MAG: hypothetical protein ACI9X4_000469 [Glaciecola sp.]|jgi:hypothetical protein
MFRQSLKMLLVVSILGLASCGATQIGAAKHNASLPSTFLLAVTTVVEVTEADRAPLADAANFSVGVSGWEATPADMDMSMPSRLPASEIIIDLGVGEAPYDDGFFDYALDYSPLVGFSDALMQLEYRARIRPGTSVFGIAAMNRIQDETILQAMDQNDWAWIAMGVQFSW